MGGRGVQGRGLRVPPCRRLTRVCVRLPHCPPLGSAGAAHLSAAAHRGHGGARVPRRARGRGAGGLCLRQRACCWGGWGGVGGGGCLAAAAAGCRRLPAADPAPSPCALPPHPPTPRAGVQAGRGVGGGAGPARGLRRHHHPVGGQGAGGGAAWATAGWAHAPSAPPRLPILSAPPSIHPAYPPTSPLNPSPPAPAC